MKHVQSVLGDHHDSVVARQEARDLGIGAHLAGENAFTYGLLHERELHRAQHLEARARHVWRHASRRRVPPLDVVGPKNSVSHPETDVLRAVSGRAVPR